MEVIACHTLAQLQTVRDVIVTEPASNATLHSTFQMELVYALQAKLTIMAAVTNVIPSPVQPALRITFVEYHNASCLWSIKEVNASVLHN